MDTTETINGIRLNKKFLLLNNFIYTSGNNANTIKIMNGNIKKRHIGIYDGGKSCAFIQSPSVVVQTV